MVSSERSYWFLLNKNPGYTEVAQGPDLKWTLLAELPGYIDKYAV